MPPKRKKTIEIRDFIIQNVEKNPENIAALICKKFGISRQAASRHLRKLVENGILVTEGNTRNKKYSLAILDEFEIKYPLEDVEEDKVWRKDIKPHLSDISPNVLNIFEYGVTEMVNNAIDHSEGKTLGILFYRTALWLSISVMDDGVGIFNKIQEKLQLDDPRHAVLELSKGKLTTDPTRHSGEGIFFTSRMFDTFSIASEKLYLAHFTKTNSLEGADVLLDDRETRIPGTFIILKLSLTSSRNLQDVFDYYTTEDNYGFDKTIVPVFLTSYGEENLISRSQAKRLLARFEKFKEIMLDFDKVERVGQAFADEIFRVFANAHPEINLYTVNINEQIGNMISRAKSANIE